MSAQERREAIVASAIPLFAESGYSAVTTREIAQAAGVSEALLYRHFGSKDDIYKAIQGACVIHAAEPAARLSLLPNNTGTLAMCIHMLMWKIQSGPEDGAENHDHMRRLICRSLLDDGEFAEEFLRQTSGIWVEKVRACLVAAIASGDVKSNQEDSELGVWLGHHLSVTIGMYSMAGREIVEYPGGRRRLLERSVLFCLRGLGMTDAAISAHYHPEQWRFLLGTDSADHASD